jgi:1-aminocyclopropane-1-carboxylate deaminase/D-cysteine desulfhydrase-like pyridoxal-dependent ACC family enzyme
MAHPAARPQHIAADGCVAMSETVVGVSSQAAAQLRQSLQPFPRLTLAPLPTPLDALPRLAKAIGDVDLYVKRDDLTGLAFGGNKARYMEFILAEAIQHGATAIISGSNAHANLPRLVAAACARIGLTCHMLLRGDPPSSLEGNLLIYALLGGEARFVADDAYYHDFSRLAEEWEAELEEAGERVYVYDDVDSTSHTVSLAALGYVSAALEAEEQFAAQRWQPDYVYLCSAMTTQAGLAVGGRALGASAQLVGVSARDKQASPTIAGIANRTASLLELDLPFATADITNVDDYIGPLYGSPTPESMEATLLAARTEGLLVDPIYTGKALAAIIDHVRSGRIPGGSRVLFWHTGGTPALFDHAIAATIEERWSERRGPGSQGSEAWSA